MPELPEVEVIAGGLDATLRGRTIQSVELAWPGCIATPAPDAFSSRIADRRFERAWRRGKFLVLDLEERNHLLVHLRMTGTLCVTPANCPPSPFLRALFHLDGGWDLRFADMRKFGRLYLVEELDEVTGDLGPEPLAAAFTPAILAEGLKCHKRHIKPLLLDQSFLAGLGNIYVDEALFVAGIHPLRRSDQLNDEEAIRLHEAIQAVLRGAIARRGTTLSDYRDAGGERGENQHYLNVYGRKGELCLHCGRPITRIVVGQRGTHFCPHCQPASEG